MEIRVTVPEPRVVVSPAALDLGAAHQGDTRTARLTVSNQGGSPCEVMVAGDAGWATAAPDRFRCAPGQSVTVTVAADTSRMGLGMHKATLAVRSTAGDWQDEAGVQVALALPWLRTFAHRYRTALTAVAFAIEDGGPRWGLLASIGIVLLICCAVSIPVGGRVVHLAYTELMERGAVFSNTPREVVITVVATPTAEHSTSSSPLTGAQIQEIVSGAPAAETDLRVGDVITAIEKISLDVDHRLADILARYRPGDAISIVFQRQGVTYITRAILGPHPDDASRPYLGIRYIDVPP